jgi:two-component system sensor histidine kinase DegS
LGDSTLGFFLLGRRDPDDLYHQSEILILQSIANQTVIAWSNIISSEQLKQMYQLGVERYEQERLRLAHDLHDVVLNELGDMRIKLGELSPELHSTYQTLTLHLREIIDDLRPPMLTHGLALAIQSLAENLMQKTGDTIKIKVDLQATQERLPENIEVHLFRIVQEACNNVHKHAQAKHITIRGSLSPDKVDLLVEDDGIGFEMSNKWELSTILVNRHFGLAGMIERAYMIGAKVDIRSGETAGTKIQISWSANKVY